ncbi:MAG: DNA repair protein RecN [Bacteroidaceae bacterium]|nr:DNA repair protein RecN [Bacteroidaceae bacterium]
MLQSIYVRNYALIDTLHISFQSGFSVITGETGAGKSILLGAISLLLGQRSTTKMLKDKTKKCIIEAHFQLQKKYLCSFFTAHDIDYDEEECILRREIQPSGKSRSFINDTPVPLTLMKEIGDQLIDIHSQHKNLLLSREQFQLTVLDTLANNQKELTSYKDAYQTYRNLEQELQESIAQAERDKMDEEYIRFQLEQLEETSLKKEEQEELEEEEKILSHAEEIKSCLYETTNKLYGEGQNMVTLLKECTESLRRIATVFTPAAQLAERLKGLYIDLKDSAEEISRHESSIDFEPERLDFINERLNNLYTLQQKHHVQSVEELLLLMEQYQKRLAQIDSSEHHIAELTAAKEQHYAIVLEKAKKLTQKRTIAAQQMANQMRERLIPLGMPNVRFVVEITPRKKPDATGMDTITYLFSANKKGEALPVASIASGGEIARVMLSMKALIAGSAQLPTILFDEIDTGVSGEIAHKMGLIMQEMSEQMQVISITHLPQIAAKGNTHYKVYKQDTEEETSSHIQLLSGSERILELAQMLSGETPTEAALQNAKELLTASTK